MPFDKTVCAGPHGFIWSHVFMGGFITQFAGWDNFLFQFHLSSMTFITLLPFKCIFWFGCDTVCLLTYLSVKCFLVLMMTFHHLKKKNLLLLFILCVACSSCVWKECIDVKKPVHLHSILCIHSTTLMLTLVPELRLHNLGIFSLHHGRIPTSHHSSPFQPVFLK